ncbi:MAG: hypothetical protein IPH32_10185 [Bacteroidetes bacterium]|nr:hypothetical protein [Bacteroidota bacterium]
MDTTVFNVGTSNFAPMYYGSATKLLFTSARKGGVLLDPEKQDSRYLCDLYYTELKDTGWMKPVNFGRPVNTRFTWGGFKYCFFRQYYVLYKMERRKQK